MVTTSDPNKNPSVVWQVGIITASDKGHQGAREDLSGKLIAQMMEAEGYTISNYQIVPDEKEALMKVMITMVDDVACDLVITTGGTGLSIRDVTPEATKAVIDREVPGIAEAIRSYSLSITKRAMLGRGTAGTRGRSLIINLPGSPKAVRESLTYIMSELPHALGILTGREGECGGTS